MTRRLPEKNRDDIALELQSAIEDMLPDVYTKADVIEVLKKLGDPAALAEQYRGRPSYLIGPGFYEQYVTCLKLVMPIALGISLIVFFIVQIAGWSGEEDILTFMTSLIGKLIVDLITATMHVFGWLTFIFVIIERSGVSPESMRKAGRQWEPEALKAIPYIPRKKAIPRAEAIASVVWTSIWAAVYFNADRFIGVYERRNGSEELEFVAPVFNQDVLLSYGLVVLLYIAAELLLAVLKWSSRQWTFKLATANTLYQLFSVILSIVILTNPDVLNQSFIDYMINLFNGTPAVAELIIHWIIGITIAILIITAAIGIFAGFRKARIQDPPQSNSKMNTSLKH
nr:hypothetical protein [uncultured Bacillus sp.]